MKHAQDGRWYLYGGRDPRGLPSYTAAEAARYVRLPRRTVQNWAFGFCTYGGDPLIRIADPDRHLLSFWNVAELHVLGTLRRHHQIASKKLRGLIRYLEETLESPHPLLAARMFTDGFSVFVERGGELVNATNNGQRAMRGLLEARLGRIDQDVDGLAVRLFPFVRHGPQTALPLEMLPAVPKVISLDPGVRFGRPVIAGTGIPTEEIAERFRAGDTCRQLADEYRRPQQEIEEVIRCELALDRAT